MYKVRISIFSKRTGKCIETFSQFYKDLETAMNMVEDTLKNHNEFEKSDLSVSIHKIPLYEI